VRAQYNERRVGNEIRTPPSIYFPQESEKRCDFRRQQKMERELSKNVRWKTVPQTSDCNRKRCHRQSTVEYVEHPETFMRRNVAVTFLTPQRIADFLPPIGILTRHPHCFKFIVWPPLCHCNYLLLHHISCF